MKSMKTLLVALVMLLCLALPFGALAQSEVTIAEEDLISSMLRDPFENWVLGTTVPGNSTGANVKASDGNEYGVEYSWEEYTIEEMEYELEISVALYDPTANVVLGDGDGKITVTLTAKKTVVGHPANDLTGMTLPEVSYTYGDMYESLQGTEEGALKEYVREGYTVAAKSTGLIPGDAVSMTIIYTPDYTQTDFWAKYVMPDNYTNFEFNALLKMQKADLTVEFPENFAVRTVGDVVDAPIVTGLVGNDKLTWLYDGKAEVPTAAGNYPLSYTLDNEAYYNVDSTAFPTEVVINKKAITLDDADVVVDYNSQEQEITLIWEGTIDGVAPKAVVTYSSVSAPKDAGDYTATVALDVNDPYYSFDGATINITINPVDVTPTMGATSSVFTNKDQLSAVAGSITFEGLLAADADAIGKSGPEEMIHAGDYTFAFGFIDEADAANYNLLVEELTYTITPADVTITIADKTATLGDNTCWPYNGQEQAAVLGADYTVDNAIEGVTYAFNLVAKELDASVLTDADYVITYDALIGYGFENSDLVIVIKDGKLNVEYAQLDAILTPSVSAVKGNLWGEAVTFTPAAGLEVTTDEGETWANSFTCTEPLTEVSYHVREAATGKVSKVAILFVEVDAEAPTITLTAEGDQPAQSAAIEVNVTENRKLSSLVCVELNINENLEMVVEDNISYEVTENGTYIFVVTDDAGHSDEEEITIDWIDTTAPTVKFSNPGTVLTTAEEITFMTDDSVDEGCDEAYIADPTVVITGPNGEEYNAATGLDSVELVYNGTYTWTVTDAAGNEKTGYFAINTIDTTVPELAVSYVTNPTNGAVVLEIEGNDVAADAKGQKAAIESTFTIYMNDAVITGNQTVTENGTYVIYVEDNVGNTTDENTVVVDFIDTTAPIVTGWEVEKTTSSQSTKVTITVEELADAGAAEDIAGIDEVLVKGPANTEYTVKLTDGVGSFTALYNGVYTISGADYVGNALVAEGEYVVDVIDTTAPELEAVIPEVDNDVASNSSYLLTVQVNDLLTDNAGIAHTAGGTMTVYCNGEVVLDKVAAGEYLAQYEATANGTYTFTAVDEAGNEAEAVSYEVKNIDLVAPVISNLQASTTAPTKDSVILTFDVADETTAGSVFVGVNYISYAFNGEDIGELTEGKLEVYANGEYTFTISDEAGNIDEETIVVDNIDVVDPVAAFSGYATTDPVSGDVTLAFSTSDDGADADGNSTAEAKYGVKSITITHDSFDAAAELAVDATELVVSYNGVYTLTVVDLAGNTVTDTIEVTNIDVVAPTLEISEDVDPAEPTSDKVVISFTAGDEGADVKGNATAEESCGIDTIVISHPSAEDTVIEMQGAAAAEKTYDALYNGVYTITVTDLAGNSVTDTIEVDNIDQVNPTIEIEAEVDPATPVSGEVVISFVADDLGTDKEANATGEANYGVASIVVAHESFENDQELAVDATEVTVAYNGVYTFTVTDKAGNVITDTIEVSNIDVVAPTFEYVSTTPAEPTSGDVVIAFTTDDQGADPKNGATGEAFYGVDSIVVEHPSFEEPMELAVDAEEVTVSYNGTYTFTVTDKAGNSVTKEVIVDNIDVVNPTIEIEAEVDPATPVSGEVVISFVADDKGTDVKENATAEKNCGVASIVVSHASFEEELELAVGTEEVSVAYNGVYTFTVTDKAGNVITDTIEVFNIDVVKPTFEHTGNEPDEATNGDVTINFTTDDEGTDPKEGATDEQFYGVDYILVDHESFDETVELAADEESLVVNANGIYTFTVVDLAGNSDVFTVEVNNIDVVAPTFEHKNNNPAAATNGDVTINFTTADTGADILDTTTAADYVAVDYILVNHASFEEAQKLEAATTSYVVSVNGVYTFTVVDLAGNSANFTVEVNNIDHTAPVASYSYAPVYHKSSDGVKITLKSTDAGEDKLGLAAHTDNYGLAKVQVTFGGKTVDLSLGANDKDVTAEYVATADGVYTFTFTDKGGNVTTQTLDMIYIDDIAPAVTAKFVGTNLRINVTDSERLAYFEICYRNTDNVIETVDMYYGLTEVPDHVYRAIDPGSYYVVVYDEAGNAAESRAVNPDRDEDGVSDAREAELGTNPDAADTDDDGLTDGQEVSKKTDPLDPDSDADGLNDGLEVSLASNPNSADSDSDGVDDYVAYQMGMLEGENQLFGAAAMLLGDAYTPAGETVEPGRFANIDDANAMMNNLEATGLATSVATSDLDTVKKELSKAVKKTNGTVVQFNANEAEGLAVVDSYLMQFSRQKNQFVANKGYNIAEMLGSEEFIVLSNADGSTVLVAPWSEAEQKTTGEIMMLNLAADRAVKLVGTAGASHMAISVSGESVAYNKDGNVIVLNLAKGQSTSSPVVDLVGLTFIDEMPVSVLKDQKAWGMENGEWKEMDFSSTKDIILDQAQRTNSYRKVLLPGVEMAELEINIQIEVIMNRGDITAKTDAMKRSVTMFDLAKVD